MSGGLEHYNRRRADLNEAQLDLECPGRVMARERVDEGTDVVLCEWGNQYVTWVQGRSDGGCVWGHYFEGGDALSKAAADFEVRVKNYKL